VMPRFVQQALQGEALTVYGDGQQTRCFCDVEDAVRAIIGLAECPEAVGQVFNVGSTDEVTILELAEKVLALVDAVLGSKGAEEQGSKGKLRGESPQTIRNSLIHPGTSAPRLRFVPYDQAYETGFEDLRRRVPDISKIKALIGWEPQVPLEETLRRVIAYYRQGEALWRPTW